MTHRYANPFRAAAYGDVQTYVTSAEDRTPTERAFDAEQCAAALRVPGLQKTVAQAVRRRMRWLASQMERQP